jgi:hypothetical protein
LHCRHCGGPVTTERADLGYDYCTRQECVDACLEPLDVVAVAVNKASDQYVLWRDLDVPDVPPRPSPPPEGGWLSGLGGRQPEPAPRPATTAARVAQLEAELERALETEKDPARRAKLRNDHNARLRRMNIRYRRSASH